MLRAILRGINEDCCDLAQVVGKASHALGGGVMHRDNCVRDTLPCVLAHER